MKNWNTWKKRIGLAAFFLSPAVMYGAFGYITGELGSAAGVYLLLNLLFFCLVYLIVFTLSNSVRGSFTALNLLFTFWAAAEYYVVEFRGRPIMIWDVLAFRTAMTVADNYNYEPGLRLVAGSVFMLLWTLLLWFSAPPRLPRGRRWKAAVGSILSAAFLGLLFFRLAIPRLGIEINSWDPKSSYSQYGYMVSTLKTLDYLNVKAPEGYSSRRIRQLGREIESSIPEQTLPWKDESCEITPTNIICIMNESYSDLRDIAPFETDLPFMEFYDSLEENCIKGDLYMPVFGSMTCNSEYEFLTGNSMAFAPSGSVPYQFYMRTPTYSLVDILKDQGYRAVALHPNERTNWNRDEAYRAMGFDEFYDFYSIEEPEFIRNYVSDRKTYEEIIRLTREKEDGEPLFLFAVTMQNHGGYEEDYEASVHLQGLGDFPMTEQYLSLIRESDLALKYLIRYFQEASEPTIIVMFGDHQPSVEDSFYETLYGCSLDETAPEDYIRRYITPFLIWTNYPAESMTGQSMSAMYLSCALLQRANIGMTDYLYFLNQMYQSAPVVHPLGYYTAEMEWEDWDGWTEKKEYPLFHQYELLFYHNLFDRNRMEELFRNAEKGG